MAHKLSKVVAKQKPIPVKIVSDSPVASTKYLEEDKKWRAQDDLRALQRAEEIRADKARMSAVKSCVTEQLSALKKIK